MKIVALMGSPRKNGSTARLVKEIIQGAEANGAEANIYYLNDMNIKWCQSCNKCLTMTTATCAIQDDVNKILADVSEADGVIFGTPIYMSTMSGQMKTMYDRFRPFVRADDTSKMKPGKKAIWAITQRNPDKTRYVPVLEKILLPIKLLGFADCKTIISSGTTSVEHLLAQKETLSEAHALGEWLAE